MIQIYNLKRKVYDDYIKQASNMSDIDEETLQRRLTALILNAQKTKKIYGDKYLYKFCNFNMIANENTKEIEMIYWDSKNYVRIYASKKLNHKLKETYSQLGLNYYGNQIRIKQLVL